MTNKTTIQVRQDTKDKIESMKQDSESLDEVVRRELGIAPQESDQMIDKLVRYLSDDLESEVREILQLLMSEFEFDYGVDESPTVSDFGFGLKHPDTGVLVFTVQSTEENSYAVSYRGTNGMKKMIGWNGRYKPGQGYWDGLGEEKKKTCFVSLMMHIKRLESNHIYYVKANHYVLMY